METIKQILMRRDGRTEDEADGIVSEAREELERRLDAGDTDCEDICNEYFGLEPDYLMELLDF